MFKRLGNLIRGFFSMFIGGIERQNPEALLEVEKENLREQISKYNRGLASHAALAERLMTQVKKQEKEHALLKAKITAHLRAGNQDAAASYALRFQDVTTEVTETRAQLDDAEKTYKNLTLARDQSVKAAKAKIETLKNAISDMKIKQATAELHEMASGMISELGGAGDTLNRLEEMVNEEREAAAGRARVAQDSLEIQDINLKEAERDALAHQALADFAAAEGISIGKSEGAPASPQAAPESTDKSMGPVAESE